MPGPWPLTGRAEELRLAVDLAASGGVVLGGAAGTGKTRLAREVLAELGRRGVATRWAVATESARSVPLGALTMLAGSANPLRRIEHAVDLLAAPDGSGRPTIGVDDVHLLDPVSAVVLQQVALAGRARLVLTLRSGEPAPDAVVGLWKDGLLGRIDLQPLSPEESRQLLEAALAGPIDTAGAQRLWAVTRGNPLYLRALVDGERAGGRLLQSDGVWQWRGRPQLSSELSELVEQRVGDLSQAERDVLDLLAFGEPLDLEVLTTLIDRSVLEVLEDRGLVEVMAGAGVLLARMGHPLYGEARRARCGTGRARRLRGRIVEALSGSAEDLLRRGVLAVDSDLRPDPDLLSAAAQRALGLPDMLVAERLARAATAAGAGFDAHMTLASALIGINRPAAAELAALADHARDDSERVRATAMWAVQLLIDARPAESADVLAAAAATVTDRGARAELHAVEAATLALLGRPEPALASAAAALAADALSPEGTTFASWGQVMASGVTGRSGAVDAAVQRGRDALRGAPDQRWLALPLAGHQLVGYRLAGRLPEAMRTAERFRDEYGDKPFGAEGSSLLFGMAELPTGRVATALRWLAEARAGLMAYPTTSWLAQCLIDMARAHAQLGTPEPARQAVDQLADIGRYAVEFMRVEAMLAEAWVFAAEGTTSLAVERAREAADFARRTGMLAQEVLALHDAVRFGDRTAAARLTALAGTVDGPLAPAAAAHATAFAADDGVGLWEAARAFERIGLRLCAADAAAHAAAAHTRSGRRGSAQLATANAARLAAECEGARTPALRASATALPLTGREREIADLIAAGLSNRDIAERLTVSVRTVEGHVYRACQRLGLSSRDELAAITAPEAP